MCRNEFSGFCCIFPKNRDFLFSKNRSFPKNGDFCIFVKQACSKKWGLIQFRQTRLAQKLGTNSKYIPTGVAPDPIICQC